MQLNIFEEQAPQYYFEKPIRLITLFSGYDSQALSLKYLNIPFEHYRTCEWAIKSIQALYDLHFSQDKTNYSCLLSDDEVFTFLANIGVSQDYNSPLSHQQIKRLGISKARTIYNQIKASHNLVNIMNIGSNDLGIIETDKYDYIMTYSFPCQDLSIAGKKAGMNLSQKDGGTRSGLLWEVERLLSGCKELPKILLMENVPEVVGTRNIKDFEKWEKFLSGLGYSNFAEILNAKNYGIPQNRERCFMVSILGNHTYYFPKIIELKHKLKDLLEHQVNQKYYLSNETIKNISKWKAHQCPLKDIDKVKNISPCLTARGAGEEHSGMILINEKVMTYNYGKSDNFMNGKSRIRLQEASDTIATKLYYGIIVPKNDLQIRKLTPKECFRLMGVKDEDYDKIATNQSDTGLYHLAGDSIVVNVLMAIFGQFKMEEK